MHRHVPVLRKLMAIVQTGCVQIGGLHAVSVVSWTVGKSRGVFARAPVWSRASECRAMLGAYCHLILISP